ncbi:glycosyltransferase family protein [Candidatus Micrarchaeota archaeon]|nr:glycosyltransferase family protein [Candidatus Micrarchaeota archaeon]
MKKKIVAIVQARMGSSRLPGKSLKIIRGKPLILLVLERVRKAKTIDEIIVAIPARKQDDSLAEIIQNSGFFVFRGSEKDVLDRYYQAAKSKSLDIVVRITGDCPLIDPAIIDKAVKFFVDNNYRFVSNSTPDSPESGFDVEVFSFKDLEIAWRNASLLSEREHVTPYLKKHLPNSFVHIFSNDRRLNKLHCSVDRPEDLIFVKKLYDMLAESGKEHDFSYLDVLVILEKNPDLKKLNKNVEIGEGYRMSLKEDRFVY